jgi:hypothetical protein
MSSKTEDNYEQKLRRLFSDEVRRDYRYCLISLISLLFKLQLGNALCPEASLRHGGPLKRARRFADLNMVRSILEA